MINVGVAGRFKLEAVNEETGERRELAPWFNNLILDQGLNVIGTTGLGYFCHVGTGTNAPSVSDTALGNKLAHTTTTTGATVGGSASVPYYGSYTVVYRFAAGVATGNLTEVGVGYSPTLLFSRTLIKDSSGNPTSITILAAEALDVTYEFRLYPPTTDVAHSTVIGGVTHTGVIRAAAVTSFTGNAPWYAGRIWGGGVSLTASDNHKVYNGAIGPLTGVPSGTQATTSDPVMVSYSANSLQRAGTITSGLSQANVAGGITATYHPTSLGAFQISFSPAIPKDATKVLTFGLTLSWNRMVI